ncbi:MAG: hypothetical protein JSW40_10040 [Candidatus Omnitrophota bacterium]|nr:MAG: hypothetical protein JSW40_10040 [Candidatus Omnitrophota bacterium]
MTNKVKGTIAIILSSFFLLYFLPKVFLACGIVIAAITGRLIQFSSFETGRLLGNAVVYLIIFVLFIIVFIWGIRLVRKSK